ncbi:hypothetical protein Rumeso_03378 [Rubellimicrobium mesophilum DSM 19309]|uniref:Right handed beta helix domain-containing protein n=1 Tax=Rubellimicrobium mesophilum DSM 19309 TaxID=442562 RepID=A0A017HL79_9RHOB|nr:hypothetical protein [Rubellimicrobium mesophilum]EYD75050.1 hypothetical protein Rumeso_03378 [Rubellimicrobium mesophilum DSM 19309]
MTLAVLPSPNYTGPDLALRVNAALTELRAARRFATVAALLADTSLAYGNGSRAVAAGDLIEAEGFRYQVAASGAADHNLTTAGGVKLQVRPGPEGCNARAFGARLDGTTDDSAAVLAALAAAVAASVPLIIAGNANLAGWSTPTHAGKVVLRGAGKGLATLTGAAGKALVTLAGGGSFSARGLGFSTWESVCRLADNASTGAFDLLEMDDCRLTGILVSAISDAGTYAPGGITELRFTGNTATACGRTTANAAALRLDCAAIASAFVHDNEIRGIGGATWAGQKDGISLGAVSRTASQSIIVTGNRIHDVQNSDAAHISGITAFGPNVHVRGNTVHTVRSAAAGNVDQYAIYVKATHSLIDGNTCTDAGGNAACIMSKGAPNDAFGPSLSTDDFDNIVSRNVVVVATRSGTLKYTGITVYNGGHLVEGNLVKGTTEGIVEIPPLYAAVAHNVIRGNKIKGLSGASGQNAIGIQTKSPSCTTIEGNEIVGVGSGVETTAYGIYMLNDAEGAFGSPFGGLTIRGNTIRIGSAASASNARAIMLGFHASGSYAGLVVEGNVVEGFGRGLQASYGGTVSGVEIARNRFRNCSVAAYGYSGTAPADGVVDGNTVAGLPYLTAAAGATTPDVSGINHLRTANAAATTIANLTGGSGNQRVLLEIADAFTTVANNANIRLAGGVSWTPANGGLLHLVRMGGVWKEAGRTAY